MTDPDIDLSIPTSANAFVPLPANYQTPTFPTASEINNGQKAVLTAQGFPAGLARDLVRSTASYPLRFWVIDNSGSMRSTDGHQIMGTQNNIKVVPCTRWAELQGTVDYHIDLAALLQVTTIFRLLNSPLSGGPQEFSVAEWTSGKTREEEVHVGKNVMRKSEPQGVTPLTEHVKEIRRRIVAVESVLRSAGQQAVIVLATDGLPSDSSGVSSKACQQEFVNALHSLQSLPVWLVIRLCTDDDSVVEYYNNLDQVLELPLEVIDDFFGEAKEIHAVNKWLNYALPLHRCREMGYHHRIFDLLDERLLNKDELKEFIQLLFGEESLSNLPDVHLEWKGFCAGLTKVLQKQGCQWNPNTRKVEYWIDIKKLQKAYGGGGGFRLFGRE